MAEQFGDADTINDAKSHLSDAASIIKEAAEKGQDWRQALQDSGKWSALKEAAKRSEEHTSELQSLMRISYAVFCLKKKKTKQNIIHNDKKSYTHRTQIITIQQQMK